MQRNGKTIQKMTAPEMEELRKARKILTRTMSKLKGAKNAETDSGGETEELVDEIGESDGEKKPKNTIKRN